MNTIIKNKVTGELIEFDIVVTETMAIYEQVGIAMKCLVQNNPNIDLNECDILKIPYPEYDNINAQNIIEYEGIGYALQHYTNSYHFKDKKTRELWYNAQNALAELEDYINKD